MNQLKKASILLAALTSVNTATALETEYYGKIDLGYNMGKYENSTYHVANSQAGGVASSIMTMKNHMGFLWGVGGGYYWTNSIRVEGSISAATGNSVNKIKSSDANVIVSDSTVATLTNISSKLEDSTYSGMMNLYYDMLGYSIMPYITAGAGIISKEAKITTTLAGDTNTSTVYDFKRTIGLAYQGGVGASYKVSTGVFLDAGYKYTKNLITLKCKANGQKIKALPTHAVTMGIRVDF